MNIREKTVKEVEIVSGAMPCELRTSPVGQYRAMSPGSDGGGRIRGDLRSATYRYNWKGAPHLFLESII